MLKSKYKQRLKLFCVAYIFVFMLFISSGVYTLTEQVNAETTVYVTKTGSKYHKRKCGRGNFYQTSLSNAKSRGLTPCKKCFPNGAPSSSSSTKVSDKTTASSTKQNIKLNKTSIVLVVNQSKKLSLKNAKGKVKWTSSKKSVASVNGKGKVKAYKKGKAEITASVSGVKKKCKVKVENPKLNKSVLELEVGDEFDLYLNGCSHEVEWDYEDEEIADVDDYGCVCANGAGSTYITASVHGKEFICQVIVSESDNMYDDTTYEEDLNY